MFKRMILALALALAAHPAWGFELTDDAGRALRWDKPFSRVVSLYGAHAENLASMGAARELVGVSEPLEGVQAAQVSARDGAERIAALGPDLVLARPMHLAAHPGLAAQMESLGVAVVCLQPGSVDDLAGYWLALGRLTGREAQAQAMVQAFAADVAAIGQVTARIPAQERKRVFFEAIHRQMKTVSPGSMAAYVLELAGGVNLASDAQSVAGTNIAHFGLERLVAMGDRVDVYLAQQGPMNPVTLEEILATPGLAGVKAVREGRVYLMDEALLSRPTPRLAQGAREVGAILYPERFARVGALQ